MYFGKKQIEDCIRIIGLKELLVLWVYSVWDDTKHNSVRQYSVIQRKYLCQALDCFKLDFSIFKTIVILLT